jgi:hypothetical protein
MIYTLVILIATGYYLIVTSRRYVLHLMVIASFAVKGIGSLFRILHWTGADEILMISYIGFGLGGVLLMWTGLRNPEQKLLYYHIVAGVLISLIVISSFVPVVALERLAQLLPYPLAAITGTIILREDYVHQGEKNILNMYFIFSITVVVSDLLKIMS